MTQYYAKSLQYIELAQEFSQVLLRKNINLFNFVRVYNDGGCVHLSNSTNFIKSYYGEQYYLDRLAKIYQLKSIHFGMVLKTLSFTLRYSNIQMLLMVL